MESIRNIKEYQGNKITLLKIPWKLREFFLQIVMATLNWDLYLSVKVKMYLLLKENIIVKE